MLKQKLLNKKRSENITNINNNIVSNETTIRLLYFNLLYEGNETGNIDNIVTLNIDKAPKRDYTLPTDYVKNYYVKLFNKYNLINVDLIYSINKFHKDNNIEEYTFNNFTQLYDEYVKDNSKSEYNKFNNNVNYFNEYKILGDNNWFKKIINFINYYKILFITLIIYVGLNFIFFYMRYVKFYKETQVENFKPLIAIAKGTAGIIYININLVLLFSFIGLLFNYSNSLMNYQIKTNYEDDKNLTKFKQMIKIIFHKINLLYLFLPFYLNHYFHYISGGVIFVASIIHSIVHTISFISISNTNNCCIHNMFNLERLNIDINKASFLNLLKANVVWSGYLLISIIILNIVILILYKKNKLRHAIFFFIHVHTFILWFILLFIHGTNSWLGKTQVLEWCSIILLLYIFQKKERLFYTKKITCYKARIFKDKFIQLEFKKDQKIKNWTIHPNMDIFIAFKKISWVEWHRFSIVSGPEYDTVVLYIKIIGSWTKKLKEYIDYNNNLAMPEYLNFNVERFNNNILQYYRIYRYITFISNGVGLNTFNSFIRDFMVKHQTGDDERYKFLNSINIIWIINDYKDYAIFHSTLENIHKCGLNNRIKLYLYFTYNINSYHKTFLEFLQYVIYRRYKYDIISGLFTNNLTILNKPNFTTIFQNLLSECEKNEKMGIFFCGSKGLKNEVLNYCYTYSNNKKNVKLDFYNVQ